VNRTHSDKASSQASDKSIFVNIFY
jgi:hypothetical protein